MSSGAVDRTWLDLSINLFISYDWLQEAWHVSLPFITGLGVLS